MLYRRALDHAGAATPAEPEEIARVAEALGDVYLLSATVFAGGRGLTNTAAAPTRSDLARGVDAPQDRLGALR